MQAANLTEKSQRPDQLIYIYGTIADYYLIVKNKTERKKYLLLANGIAEKFGAKQFLAMGYSSLTHGALIEGNYAEALTYGKKAIALLRENPYPVLKIRIDSMMSAVNYGLGNYSEAYTFLKSYVKENNLLVSNEQQKQLNELMVNLQVREKDFEMQTKEFQDWKAWNQNQTLEMNTLQVTDSPPDEIQEKQASLNAQSILFSHLRDIFDKQKLYLDSELNLNSIIKILGTNRTYLHQTISENSDNNFRSFVNRYRVNEAKQLIEEKIRENEPLNLSDIYSLVGFNSPVSFYRAFKQTTGLTPKDYAAEFKIEFRKDL